MSALDLFAVVAGGLFALWAYVVVAVAVFRAQAPKQWSPLRAGRDNRLAAAAILSPFLVTTALTVFFGLKGVLHGWHPPAHGYQSMTGGDVAAGIIGGVGYTASAGLFFACLVAEDYNPVPALLGALWPVAGLVWFVIVLTVRLALLTSRVAAWSVRPALFIRSREQRAAERLQGRLRLTASIHHKEIDLGLPPSPSLVEPYEGPAWEDT